MSIYLPRYLETKLLESAARYPAVVITGPRQVGKTSLVKAIQACLGRPSVYLDLEYPEDQNKLSNPALFFEHMQEQVVIIDEVQRMPSLFPVLRAVIDRFRQPGRFILLGSASPEIIRDASESLAGRVAYLELMPLSAIELPGLPYSQLWLRGGFPESVLAAGDADSLDWRENFIQTYLERDLPLLGLKADPMLVRRLWTMLAHLNGQLLNLESLSRSLGITSPTVRRYMDFLESAFLITRLAPYAWNTKKRLVKSPKVFLRDTGLLHSLLSIQDYGQLLGHPSLGSSWEAYVFQQIRSLQGPRTELHFYRTQDGAEADLIVAQGGVPKAVAEIKFSTSPKPSRGFYEVMQDLGLAQGYLICPVESSYPLSERVTVLSHRELGRVLG